MQRLISIIIENEAGALSRVIGLFSQRGYNIETLSVAPLKDNSMSQILLTTICPDAVASQISKNVERIVSVISVKEHPIKDQIEFESNLKKALSLFSFMSAQKI